MSDWSMWKAGRVAARGAIEQMDAAGVTNLYVDTENTTNPKESLRATFFLGEEDGKPVVQIDGTGDFRVNVNDGVVFDRHTESNSAISDAALAMYHKEVSWGAGPNRTYSKKQLEALREELIQAGYAHTVVDSAGRLEDL
jgi:hypothetical protein